MDNKKILLMIVVASVCTFITRVIPFALFGGKKEVPKIVKYLGDILPTAIIGVLIVYCLKDVVTLELTTIIPQVVAVIITGALHLWKRNVLISIAGGTISYMLIINLIIPMIS